MPQFKDSNDFVIPGAFPIIASQSVAYTGTAGVVTNAVGTQTKLIRVICTTDAYVALGAAPTATSSDIPIAANVPQYFRAVPGVTKVSAIRQVTSGTLFVQEVD